MDNNKILNAKVHHEVFGSGIIKNINGNVFTVDFTTHGEKKFMYPDSFVNFLTLSDPALEKAINTDIDNKKNEEEAEKVRSREKFEKEQQEKNAKKLPKSKSKKSK